jgi:DNA topoisomerase-3
VHGILQKLTNYAVLTEPLLGKRLKKSSKVFNKKVTDHHAIIPTGFSLTYNTINSRYMTLLKRFIAVFMTIVQ